MLYHIFYLTYSCISDYSISFICLFLFEYPCFCHSSIRKRIMKIKLFKSLFKSNFKRRIYFFYLNICLTNIVTNFNDICSHLRKQFKNLCSSSVDSQRLFCSKKWRELCILKLSSIQRNLLHIIL